MRQLPGKKINLPKRSATMRILLITLALSLSLTFCEQVNNTKNEALQTSVLSFDTSIIAILPYNAVLGTGVFENCKPAQLTNDDIALIERLLTDCINEYNSRTEKSLKKYNRFHEEKYLLIDLKQHKRQYVVVTNSSGEKEVWINCFCDAWGFNNSGWRKYPIDVDDGGNCYFNLKINLTTGKYYDLMVNGYG